MTTITLYAKLDGQVQSIAQQMGTTVDEIVNNILEKYSCALNFSNSNSQMPPCSIKGTPASSRNL